MFNTWPAGCCTPDVGVGGQRPEEGGGWKFGSYKRE